MLLDYYTDSHTLWCILVAKLIIRDFLKWFCLFTLEIMFGLALVEHICEKQTQSRQFLEQRSHRNIHGELGNAQRSFSIQGLNCDLLVMF